MKTIVPRSTEVRQRQGTSNNLDRSNQSALLHRQEENSLVPLLIRMTSSNQSALLAAPPPRREFAGPFADQNDQLEPISTAPPPRREFAGPFADQNDQLIVGSLSSPVGSTVDSGYPSLEFTDSCSGSSNVSWAEEEKPPARIRPLAPPPQKQHPHCLPRYKTIEVAPGQHLRLRGADETTQAIQDDFYIPCECSCCTKTILCIQDADYVLCPDCRVVSPIREQLENDKSNGGVGLGFKVESLFADSTF